MDKKVALVARHKGRQPAPQFDTGQGGVDLRGLADSADDLVLLRFGLRAFVVAQQHGGDAVNTLRGADQLVMCLVIGLEGGAGGLQALWLHRQPQGLAGAQPQVKVGKDVARLDVVHVLGGPVEFGVIAGRFDPARAALAVAALDDKVAVLVVAGKELVQPVEHFAAVLLHGLLNRLGSTVAAVFGCQRLRGGYALGLRQLGGAFALRHAGFDAKLLLQVLQAKFVCRQGFVIAGRKSLVQRVG